jgi:hypothetical protein
VQTDSVRLRRSGARRGRLVALLVAASLSLLTGCGAAGSTRGPSGRAAMLSTLENWSALETPVDQALGILTQRCMAQHGLRFYPFPLAGQPGGSPFFASPLFGSSLWLGPQSLAWRIVNGWGLYEQMMQQLSQPGGFSGGRPQEMQIMQSLRGRAMQAYMKTLWGGGKSMKIRIPGLGRQSVQIGGCNTAAGKQLFGSVAASVAVPQYGPAILNGNIQPGAARSPAVRASEARWAACVRAGTKIVTRSPSQLFMRFYALYQNRGPTPEIHRKELAAAVTDYRCQQRAHLPQTLRQASLAAVGHLPPTVTGELATLLAVLDQARTRAQALFARPATSTSTGTTPSAGGSTAPGSTAPSGSTVPSGSTAPGSTVSAPAQAVGTASGSGGSGGSVVIYGGG